MGYIRDFMQRANWDARLLVIKGPKGVGKSTLLQQFIKTRFDEDDRLKAWAPDETRL
jgi:ATP/maltotriose-dependent transcriptional regulator MalT